MRTRQAKETTEMHPNWHWTWDYAPKTEETKCTSLVTGREFVIQLTLNHSDDATNG